MDINPSQSISYFKTQYTHYIKEFRNFLKIPSVSTDPDHVKDIQEAANFLIKKLNSLGCEHVKAYKTQRHPIVYGDWLKAGSEAPTLLVYGHYDVQPPDPLEEWETRPFEPAIRGDYLFARGASDMKGQVMAALFAIESVLHTSELHLNVKFILEGEEEIGSPSLDEFMEKHKDLLAADFVLNPDAGMIAPDVPSIVYSLRGLAYFELRVDGPKHDLHSGLFGGIVENPAHVISKIIADLHDADRHVTLPGFYDRVRPLSEEDRKKIASLKISDTFYIKATGVPKLWGEKGFTTLERAGARPTLDVNGLYSGFIGEGGKTIIPAYAKAKISCRLVPDQDPDEVHKQLRLYLETHMPDTVTWNVTMLSGAPAYLCENAPGLDRFVDALEAAWGKPVAYKREGGSIPVATSMKEILGVDSILTGFGLPDDHIHSPNERLHLPTWKRGIKALILFILSFNNHN